MNAMEISRTGLDVEWRRLEVIANNIANSQSVITADGSGYRPMQLMSGPAANFADVLAGKATPNALRGVAVYSVEPQNLASRRAYDPGNPHADAAGYVTYPGYDHVNEMTQMAKATRSYEANIVALNAARQMYSNALNIGKRA